MRKLTQQEVEKRIFDLVGDEYTMLGEYKGNSKKVLFRHNVCGHEFLMKTNSFIDGGQRCPIHAGNIKKTTDQFKNDVYSLVGDEYEVLGEYKDNKTKILMKHKICGCEWNTRPNDFISGYKCPRCCQSKGEAAVEKWLIENNILYECQSKTEDCKNIRPLPFDFAIEVNGVIATIEYDGIQHYKPSKKFGQEEAFIKTKRNDEIKTKFCKENNIPLLRIKYDNKNIEETLNAFVLSLGGDANVRLIYRTK